MKREALQYFLPSRFIVDLNARVYTLFGLTDDENALIEVGTKYKYGEV